MGKFSNHEEQKDHQALRVLCALVVNFRRKSFASLDRLPTVLKLPLTTKNTKITKSFVSFVPWWLTSVEKSFASLERVISSHNRCRSAHSALRSARYSASSSF
jgi:hypothetical protein